MPNTTTIRRFPNPLRQVLRAARRAAQPAPGHREVPNVLWAYGGGVGQRPFPTH